MFKKLLLITFIITALLSSVSVILLNYNIKQPLEIKQDVFITSFEMSGENEITITNEKDESFVFNINSHKVIKKKPWYSFFD